MSAPSPEAPILRVRSGAQAGRTIVVSDVVVVGRDADVVIADDEISRRHAEIRPEGHGVTIDDLGSSNGTWVNGRRVAHAVLRTGDVVRLGRTIFEVVVPSSPATTTRISAGEPNASPIEPRNDAREEELRPITALFADVVGSTALGERLDPDEISALIGDCVSRMGREVERFGGTVASYMGDGIAAFFGLERASEHDTENAARAALAIISAISRYATEVEETWGIANFNVRVGVNSGDAAVGELGPVGRSSVALGDTTNVAARLQSLAEPGTIAVGGETGDELRSRFLLEPLGEFQVKGRQAPVRAWQLVGTLARPTAPDRRRLVGREAEVERLRAAVAELAAGRGGMVFVVGDLGMGKTRLLAELEDLVGDRAAILHGFCAASPASPAYGPFTAILRAWVGIEPDGFDSSSRDRLHRRLETLDGLPPAAADALALLLDARLDPVRGRGELEPTEAYRAWVDAVAARRSLVIALDDIHWLEPSAAVLALGVAELTARRSLLIVCTLRPDVESHGWRLRTSARFAHPTRAKELNLHPLADERALELVGELAPDVEGELRDQVVERAEGNPLFIEHLLRAAREGQSFAFGGRTVRTVATARLLPPALASVLVGRIDGLPPEARKVAQYAAAIGRAFPRRLLERVVEGSTLDDAVEALIRAGIVAQGEPEPNQSWIFTHALLRDAALSTLVRSRRREIFGRVAVAFEEFVGEAADEHLDLLAYYFARSEDSAKALRYNERAAERAFRLGADTEASDRLRKAAQFADQLEDEGAAKRIAARLDDS